MDFLIDGPEDSRGTFVFAHGAGGAMDGPFMNRVALGIAAAEIRVVRFEFPYMSARRRGEKRGMPDRQPILLDCWRDVVRELGGGEHLVIGGKSLGGRMASMVADELAVAGLLCLGYPFHPPGQPTKLRTAHLETLKTRALIVQEALLAGRPVVASRVGGIPELTGEDAAALIMRAEHDGYTLLASETGFYTTQPHLYSKDKLAYDVERDFVPVAGYGTIPTALLVNPSVPVNSVADLIALARKKPGDVTFGTAGVGTALLQLLGLAGVKT